MPDSSPLILPTLFCPPAGYYRAMLRHKAPVVIDTATRFNKRLKLTHRCMVADARGPMELTVPIAKPYGPTWDRVDVSLHGNWWEMFRTALESAYGRTPYFEFFIDDFAPLLNPGSFSSVADLNRGFDTVIRRCIDFPASVTYSALSATEAQMPVHEEIAPYWQIRADKFGFIPGLSILDMVFNLGPETVIHLL